MRDMKFDVDIILRNCEHFGVKVEKGENLHGVTMNGNPFDVTDEMDKALQFLPDDQRGDDDNVVNHTQRSINNQPCGNPLCNRPCHGLRSGMG
jgi:hypothetical protein